MAQRTALAAPDRARISRALLVLALAAACLAGGCGGGHERTRVRRTSGPDIVGVLVETRPDAVVLRVDGREVRVPLSEVASISREPTAGAPDAAPAASGSPTAGPSTATPDRVDAPAPTRTVDLIVPAGTKLPLTIASSIGSARSRASERVDATLAQPLLVGPTEALPAGVAVAGAIVESVSSDRGGGRGRVVLRFDRLTTPLRADIALQAAPVRLEAAGRRQRRGLRGVFDKVIRGTKSAFGVESADGNIRLDPGSRVVIELAQPLSLRVAVKG